MLLPRSTSPVIKGFARLSGGWWRGPTAWQAWALTAALGRSVPIDGTFGSVTEAAVRDYQSSRGLFVDGYVGEKTWSALQRGR